MKKLITIVLLVVASLTGSSQDNFKWEKVDSVNKTKEQLYSDTKVFIAKTWKSANDVIQNDDKENGNIIVKGVSMQSLSGMELTGSSNTYNYYYSYTIQFKFKDNKFKLIVDNVDCNRVINASSSYNIPTIQPNSEFPGIWKALVKEKGWNYVKLNLKSDLQNIVDSYNTFIKTTIKDDF